MAIAFASSFAILVQVSHDLTFNQSIPDAERIYRFEYKASSLSSSPTYSSHISRVLGERFGEYSPTVESFATVSLGDSYYSYSITQDSTEIKFDLPVSQTSYPGAAIWGADVVEGDLKLMERPNTVAIGETTAQKYNLKIGDQIKQPDGGVQEIVAIYKDFPRNHDMHSIQLMGSLYLENYKNSSSEWGFNYYYKLYHTSDKEAFIETAYKLLATQDPMNTDATTPEEIEEFKKQISIRLTPINKIHFSEIIADNEKANLATTWCLLGVAVIILLIAYVNFINFFMAMVPRRIRAVNTEKVFGCSMARLRMKFVSEAIGLVVIALLISLLLNKIVTSSSLTEFFTVPIAIEDNLKIGGCLALITLVLAILSSLYPIRYITSIPPAFALKGSFGNTVKGRRFRYALLGFQFVISIALITCSIFIKLQNSYVMNYDMGFNKEQLYTANTPGQINQSVVQRETFVSQLKSNPIIEDATFADGKLVNTSRMGWGRPFKQKTIQFDCYPVSWNFLRVLQIPVTDGRDFEITDEEKENGTFIFNESAQKAFELTLDDKVLGHDDEADIAGFCNDFKFMPLQYNVHPFAFYVFGSKGWRPPTHLYVRTAKGVNTDEARAYIESAILEHAPDMGREEINLKFFDQEMEAQYYNEKKLSRLITVFSLISICISLIGVFGLVLFETQYRRREIAIRRVNGATLSKILIMFNNQYMKIICICFVLSIPISYFFIYKWLQGFAFHIAITPWPFLLALLIVLAITSCIVILRSWKSASENPTQSLYNE